VRHDTPETIHAQLQLLAGTGDPRLVVTFPVELPAETSPEEITQWLSVSGYTRVQAEREVEVPAGAAPSATKPGRQGREGRQGGPSHAATGSRRKVLDVVADRFRLGNTERGRVCWRRSRWPCAVAAGASASTRSPTKAEPQIWKFSTGPALPGQ
jgi:excinuclease ABC subunit A